MANSGLIGPYPLAVDTIDIEVKTGTTGAYALGHVDHQGRFVISSVGRDDREMNQRLRSLVGTSSHFKYLPLADAKLAFEKECDLFHAFRPPGNHMHPARPEGTDWQCPHCISFLRLRR